MELLEYLELDKKMFTSMIRLRKKQKKQPTLLAFLTPSFNLFDLFRITKLSQLVQNNFFLILVIKDSDRIKMDNFEHLINLCIPKNKIIYKYLDIYTQLIKDSNFRKIFSNCNISKLLPGFNSLKNLKDINKNDLSLSDIESFLTQNYILRNSNELLGSTPDFFLTSDYKNSFFNYFNLNEDFQLTKIKISDTPCNFNFLKSTNSIERELSTLKIRAEDKGKMQHILSQIMRAFNYNEKFDDFHDIVLFLKKKLFEPKYVEELFLNKDNHLECISAINNNLRRDILGIIYEHGKLKAEAIRNKINQNYSRKYTLTSIIKNLEILTQSKLLQKNDRFYELTHQRIIMNIPINWMIRSQKYLR